MCAWSLSLLNVALFSLVRSLPPLRSLPAAALALPAADAAPCGDVIAARATEGVFKVNNHGRSLEYTWDLETFPWLCLWTEHKSRTDLPWEGVERTRTSFVVGAAFADPLNAVRAERVLLEVVPRYFPL